MAFNYYFYMLEHNGRIAVTEEMTSEQVTNPFTAFRDWVKAEKWNHKKVATARLVFDPDGTNGFVLCDIPVNTIHIKDYEIIRVVSANEFLSAGQNKFSGIDFFELFDGSYNVDVVDDSDENDMVDIVLNHEDYGILIIIHEVNAHQLNYLLGFGHNLNVGHYPNFDDYVTEVLLKHEQMTEMEKEVWSSYFYLDNEGGN
jgi:hypothetical protein